MAGLRTNTLVAIGAASFVIFAGLAPGEASPMRVAAKSDAVLEQVVGRLSLEPTVSAASWSVEALAE